MWLVSCRKQGMLTQGPTPNPMCKLNVSSFLTLPHLLDCFSCTRNSVFIVLFLGIMWGWDRWRGGGAWLFHIRLWVGEQGVGINS